jgi:YbbR domain-containing protein
LRASKIIDVKPRVIGALAPGYRLATVSSDPATITIVGPKTRVDKVEGAMTDPIDASGVQGRQTFTTTAYVNDPLVRVMAPVPVRVTVATERGGATPDSNSQAAVEHRSTKGKKK